MSDRLEDRLEREERQENKRGHTRRSFVHLRDSLEKLQGEDFGFTEEDIGKFYTGLVLQNRSSWLSHTDPSFIKNEGDSRGVRKKFQDETRDLAVRYAQNMYWRGLPKDEIIAQLEPERILEVPEESIKPGTIEYGIVKSLEQGADYEDIGRRVLAGARRYISRVNPGKRKENVFIEYRTIEDELSQLIDSVAE